MARFTEPTLEQETGWKEWVAERPPHVRAVAERFDPWSLYRMKTTDHLVSIYAFNEEKDGKVTVKVNVTGEFNFVMFDRTVFGIDPNDLEPCELPNPKVFTGTILTGEEVDKNLDALRVMIRPDLWNLDKAGKAIPRAADKARKRGCE